MTSPALRYFGAKWRLAPWIVQMFPAHRCYVEPFGGAAGVLLQKRRSYSEVYNDLDGDVVNFWRVLRDPPKRAALIDAVSHTPYAREEFELSWEATDDEIERARRLCIRAQMGFGSAGATKGSTGFRIDTARAYGTAQHLWLRYPDAIAAAGQRFQGVLIENRPAIDVMANHDAPDTLHFVDPPYLPEVRRWRTQCGYKHEMTPQDHLDLLRACRSLSGYVLICGYRSEMYLKELDGWQMRTKRARISAGRGGASREECVWMNPRCAASEQSLFAQRSNTQHRDERQLGS